MGLCPQINLDHCQGPNELHVDKNSHQFNFHMPHKKKDDFFSISKTCCKHTQTHTLSITLANKQCNDCGLSQILMLIKNKIF